DDLVIKAYCWGRFLIMRQRFLDEIGQYLPRKGEVLDLGCGFGLFSLYYALLRPELRLRGFDLNRRRIEVATRAAAKIGLENVHYEPGDVREFSGEERFQAAYMLDIVHHIPRSAVRPLLEQIARCLPIGGRLVVKDVGDEPAYKRWFTFWLDKLMDPRTKVSYWSPAALQTLLEKVGFEVYRHLMVDYLPYPHVLFACKRVR
ncbi:MAG: class I SAM-dependent methyltransferase, partial [Planctomycetota bacterium]